MAIKGYLGEINFVEILKIVGKLSGRLTIWNFADKKQYECFFHDDSIVYMSLSGKLVPTKESAKDVFFELLTDNQSYYAFQDEKPSAGAGAMLVSVAEVLDFSLFEKPAVATSEELLPHIDTKFEISGKNDSLVQGELASFWKTTVLHFNRGCSGRDICVAFGFEENEVRQNIYKLRTAGLIKPVRMFNAANPALRNKMMAQNLGKIAGRLNGVSKINPSIAQKPSPTVIQSIDVISASNSEISAPKNVPNYFNQQAASATSGNFPHFQNNNGSGSEKMQETVPLPAQPGILVNPPLDADVPKTQVPPVFAAPSNNPEIAQNFAPNLTVLNSSSVNFQNNVNEAISPTPTYSVNVAGNNADVSEKQPEKQPANLVIPERTNLLRRMLSSIFSR